jgi:hypothetical protein
MPVPLVGALQSNSARYTLPGCGRFRSALDERHAIGGRHPLKFGAAHFRNRSLCNLSPQFFGLKRELLGWLPPAQM